ncbi:YihY/virulence factor BrkB family protein [Azospirillum sp. sgz301742]
MQGAVRVVVDAAKGWFNDGAMSMGAAIAFYTIFSLAPIAILVTAVAGLVFGDKAAQGALADQLSSLIGPDAAQTVQGLVASADDKRTGVLASALGIGTLVVGATTVFTELQASLDRIWKAAPPPDSAVSWLVTVRLKGLALIGATGFLLIVSLLVSTALAALGRLIGQSLPEFMALLRIAETLASWAVLTALFALIYRVLPTTRLPWRDLWLGAAVTALLFSVGKLLIGLYLGTSGVTSVYGAAGSFVLILLWVYYSTTIFLFGAEITRAYSERVGSRSVNRTARRSMIGP